MNWIVNFYEILKKSEEIVNDTQYASDEEREKARQIYEITFKHLLNTDLSHSYNEELTQLFLNGRVFVLRNTTPIETEARDTVGSYNNYIKAQEENKEEEKVKEEDLNNYVEMPESLSPQTLKGHQKDYSMEEIDYNVENIESPKTEDISLKDDKELPGIEKSNVSNIVSVDDIDEDENLNDQSALNEVEDFDMDYEEPESFDEEAIEEMPYEEPTYEEPESFDEADEDNLGEEFDDDFDNNVDSHYEDDEKENDDNENVVGDEDLEVDVNEEDLDFPDYPVSMHYSDFTLNKYALQIYKGKEEKPINLILLFAPLRNDIEYPDYMFGVFQESETDLNVIENNGDALVYSIFDDGAQYDLIIHLAIEDYKCRTNITINYSSGEVDRELDRNMDYKIKLKEPFGMGEMGHVLFVDDRGSYRIHIVPIQEENGKHGRANFVYYLEPLTAGEEGFIGDTSKARNNDGSLRPSFEIDGIPYIIDSRYDSEGVLYTNIADIND